MLASIPLCYVMLLLGCVTPAPVVMTKVQEIRQELPPNLLTCAPKPLPPVLGPSSTDADVVGFIGDLEDAYDDCATKLDAVRGLQVPPTPAQP